LGFDAPASDNIHDADDQRRLAELEPELEPEPEPEPEPEQQKWPLTTLLSRSDAGAAKLKSQRKRLATTAGTSGHPSGNIVDDHKSKSEQVQPHEVQVDMAPDTAAQTQSQANATARDEATRRALTSELLTLSMLQLRKRAAAVGASNDEIEDARDADAPKQAMVSLILSRSS
jgi:predicted flavoprotein YhiN